MTVLDVPRSPKHIAARRIREASMRATLAVAAVTASDFYVGGDGGGGGGGGGGCEFVQQPLHQQLDASTTAQVCPNGQQGMLQGSDIVDDRRGTESSGEGALGALEGMWAHPRKNTSAQQQQLLPS